MPWTTSTWPTAPSSSPRARITRRTPSWRSPCATCAASRGLAELRLEQHLDGAGLPRGLQRQHRLVPAVEREPVRDDRRQVEAVADEVEVVRHGVLGRSAHLFDAEAVRADNAQLLEVQRGPLEAPGRLHAGDDERAACREQPQRRLDVLAGADGVVDDGGAVLEPVALAPRRERRGADAPR